MRLLDTDVMVDLFRNHTPAVEWLRSLGDEAIGLPGYVVMELLKGRSNKDEAMKQWKTLEGYTVYWPDERDCNKALVVFMNGMLSHNLGAFDALIAECAIGLDASLVTFNTRHYNAVAGLQTEQPYSK